MSKWAFNISRNAIIDYSMAKSITRKNVGKRKQSTSFIVNRRANFDYELTNKTTVGIELTGLEVKAARSSRVSLKGAYVVPKLNVAKNRYELYLINASFSLTNNARRGSSDATSSVDTSARRLLAHRKEIDKFVESKKTGLTIVPVKMINSGRYIKLVIALGKGKKSYDKRQTIKKRDSNRELAKINKQFRL